MQTLLRVPDLIAAIEPLVGRKIGSDEVFRAIAARDIKPFGYVLRAPVFTPGQVTDVAVAITKQDSTKAEVGGTPQ